MVRSRTLKYVPTQDGTFVLLISCSCLILLPKNNSENYGKVHHFMAQDGRLSRRRLLSGMMMMMMTADVTVY